MQQQPKYKLNTLIEYTTADQTKKLGAVSGILTDTTGFYYKVEEEDTFIQEAAVVKAYRQVKVGATRKPRGFKKATAKVEATTAHTTTPTTV